MGFLNLFYMSRQLILALYLLISNINQLQMSDDDDWGMESESKAEAVEQAPPSEPARGRGSRGAASDAQPATEKEQAKPAVAQEDEDAEWISEEKDKVNVDGIPDKESTGRNRSRTDRDKENTINNVRVQDNVSEVINPNPAELEVSHNEGSSWFGQANDKKDQRDQQDTGTRPRGRGNRAERDSNGYNPPHNDDEGDGNRRGHRGNRNGDNYNRPNQQGNGQRPWRDFNNERGYNNSRGGFGGNFRGNREDGRGEHRRNNREEGGGGEHRRYNREEGGENRRNNREEGGGDFRRNREGGNVGYNRGYNNRDRDYQGGNHSDRPDQRFNRNNRQNGNENGMTPQIVASKQKVVTVPGGRIWPSCQLFIMGKKLSITLRKIQDFHSKLLIVPYRNLKLDYYPGNFVISSTIDYRAKIKSKGADLEKPGRVYFQKAVGLANYSAVAFLRVDDSDESKVKRSIEEGIQSIIRDLYKIKQAQKFDTIVFPVSEQLCEPAIVIRSFSNLLQECQSVKEVSLSTKDPKCFKRCMQDYSKCIMEMIENNQLSFQ